ncbi:N-acetylmuramoyl-L-alanine amidase family protein [Aneurinibacillus soli]|nr:N-acetylmuramoyl-L-alanine amidase [Aneurinibacillus soli]
MMKIRGVIVLFIFLSSVLFPIPAYCLDRVNTPVDILIDAGHGGIDGGAYYKTTLEKDVTLTIARLLYNQLSAKGYTVVLNRTGDYALSDDNSWLNTRSRHQKDLAQRKHLMKSLSPKITISLHANISSNPNHHGPLVLYQKNNQSFMLADVMQHTLNNLYKRVELPRPGQNLYLLNHSICPTVLVEIGFISNPVDRERMTDPLQQKQIVSAISSAVDHYFFMFNQRHSRK